MDDDSGADSAAVKPPLEDAEVEPDSFGAVGGELEADGRGKRIAGRGGTRLVYGLGAVAATLLVLSAGLMLGYARVSGDLAYSRRAGLAQEAEQNRLRSELAVVNASRDQLAKDLAAAQAMAIDPAGIELIRKCLQEAAAFERAIMDALAKGTFVQPGTDATVPGRDIGPIKTPSVCVDAEPYLK